MMKREKWKNMIKMISGSNWHMYMHRRFNTERVEWRVLKKKTSFETETIYNYNYDFPSDPLVKNLPMQGARVWLLVWEDPTCWGAAKPVCHNWDCTLDCAPNKKRHHSEKPRYHNYRNSMHSNKDPGRPKKGKL